MSAPAVITPAPTLATAVMHELMPRATTDFDYGCINYDYNKLVNCADGYVSCLGGIGGVNGANNDVSAYLTSVQGCYCTYGMNYFDCVVGALPQTCASSLGLSGEFQASQIDWYRSYCGSVPAAAMARMTPPSIVSLSLTTVRTTRLSTRSTPPPPTGTPLFTGVGNLLEGRCTSTKYTLVDAGSTVFWAGFVGCISDRPECCPWAAATTSQVQGGGGGVNTESNRMGAAFPSPQDGGQMVLSKCADDHYEVKGSCCPVGYFPFTSAVGGQTPCYSSMNRVTTAPTLTLNIEGQPTDTSRPTSAVVNVVWAVQYPVASSSSSTSLSAGAIAGIAVGGLAAVILVVAAFVCFFRYKRKPKPTGPHAEKVVPSTTPIETLPNVPPQIGVAPPHGASPPPGVQFVPQQPVQQMAGPGGVAAAYPYAAAGAVVPGQTPPGWPAPPPTAPSPALTYTPPPQSGSWPSPPPPSLSTDAAAGGSRYSNSVAGGPGSEISSLSGTAPLMPGNGSPAAMLVPHYSGSPPPLPVQQQQFHQQQFVQHHQHLHQPPAIAEADEGRHGYAVPQGQGVGYRGEEMYASPTAAQGVPPQFRQGSPAFQGQQFSGYPPTQ